MGFFDKLQRSVRGPLLIEVSVASSFSWSAGSLPVTVSLTNESDESVTILEIEVELENSRQPHGAGREVKLLDPIQMQPGERMVREVSVPLADYAKKTDAELDAELEAQGQPPWLRSQLIKGYHNHAARPPLAGRHKVEVDVKLASGRTVEKEVHIEAV